MDTRVKCKWCGEDTFSTGTRECNRCWELRTKIEPNIRLAQKMLKVIIERKNEENKKIF